MSIEAPGIQPDDVEADVRNLVRRTLSPVRTQAQPPSTTSDQLSSMVNNISRTAIAEVERTIEALQNVRDMLHDEAQNLARDIEAYAARAEASNISMKVIADSIAQWQRPR